VLCVRQVPAGGRLVGADGLGRPSLGDPCVALRKRAAALDDDPDPEQEQCGDDNQYDYDDAPHLRIVYTIQR
jgi:hypothetical protein